MPQTSQGSAPRQSGTIRTLPAKSWLPTLIFVAIFIAGTLFALIKNPQYASMSVPSIDNWWWIVLGFAAVQVSFVCQAAVLQAFAVRPLPWGVAILGQYAAAASKVVAPAASGVLGLNARLLTQNGATLASSVATVGATQVAQMGITVVLICIGLPLAGVVPTFTMPHGAHYWTVGAIVLALVGGVLFYRQYRRTKKVRAFFRQLGSALRLVSRMCRQPARLLLSVGGSVLLTGVLAVCMWSTAEAVGGSPEFVTAAVVMMVGAMLGAFVPTPGGVGGVEGAMIALYFSAGENYEIAVQAVLLFRILSFWIPAGLGLLAGVYLRRRGHL